MSLMGAAAIQAGGSILGGVLGRDKTEYHGQGATEQRAWDWFRYQWDLEHGLKKRIEAAKRSGIHPLAALGINPSYQPTSAVGDVIQGRGNDFGLPGAARAVSKAMAAIPSKDEKILRNIAVEKEQEELKRSYMQTEMMRRDLQETGDQQGLQDTPDNPFGMVGQNQGTEKSSTKGYVRQERVLPYSRPGRPGVLPGFAGMKQVRLDEHNYVYLELSQEMMELMESDWGFGISQYISKGGNLAEAIISALASKFGSNWHKEWHKTWMKILPALPDDQMYKFYYRKMRWRIVPKPRQHYIRKAIPKRR